ncbi:hypothetical protein CVIRNUC_003590 [Coccomyxa viridis]|uniref:Uncharacterized protein n=1 Tax=Coccomyxa viridis TaxID=1274662 RepID=A0AAV1I1Q9_9CHLO|nr:hypothetical protein CVIRNUC_003590 [Coccomyxa viridis]
MDWMSEAYVRWLRQVKPKAKGRKRRQPGIIDGIRGLLSDVSGQQWLCVALVSITYNCLPFRVGLFVVPLASVVACWGQRAPISGLLLAAGSALVVRLAVVASNAVIELAVLTGISALALAAVRCWGRETAYLARPVALSTPQSTDRVQN